MIVLENNKINNVVVTLSEEYNKLGITASYFIIQMNDDFGNTRLLLSDDVSINPDRFNQIKIELGLVEDSIVSKILNMEEGQWNYTIYYSTGTKPTETIIIPNETFICEIGRVLIK